MTKIEDKNYSYCFIRSDLAIETQIVQAAHSAQESGRDFKNRNPTTNTFLVLLEAKNEAALMKAGDHLINNGIKFHMFHEPDYETGFTSLTTEPIYYEEQKEIFKKFSLYKFRASKAYSIMDKGE
jgi:hypothetical protein